ncbi:MAG: penicillin-binding protein, partial [Erythrobacter sp.]|nr:penicillin-binding protein [Erythrobacter sp.]
HMLRGAVSRGTATILNPLKLPLFGKTGTTTGPKDVWFIGGTQQMIAGAYVGFDQPRDMGGYAYGGTIAAPIVKSLIEKTRDKWSDLPPVAPAGVRMVRVDRRSGKQVFAGWPSDDPKSAIIWEAFKPDTEPERYTRQDEIAAKRDEILALIRADRQNAGAAVVEDSPDQPVDFVEEQGGVY